MSSPEKVAKKADNQKNEEFGSSLEYNIKTLKKSASGKIRQKNCWYSLIFNFLQFFLALIIFTKLLIILQIFKIKTNNFLLKFL